MMADPLGLINAGQAIGPIAPQTPRGPKGPMAGEAGSPSFRDTLMKNIEQVSRLQQDAEMAVEDLAAGRRDDVDGVLIAKQKADLAFQMLLQVRNKLMDAYEELKQMRV
jgi:flagellar hook-basal body complex protein FliE